MYIGIVKGTIFSICLLLANQNQSGLYACDLILHA